MRKCIQKKTPDWLATHTRKRKLKIQIKIHGKCSYNAAVINDKLQNYVYTYRHTYIYYIFNVYIYFYIHIYIHYFVYMVWATHFSLFAEGVVFVRPSVLPKKYFGCIQCISIVAVWCISSIYALVHIYYTLFIYNCI